MSARPGAIGPALAGRSGELEVLGALLERATDCEAGALLVSGDAGVGKTALVQNACAAADPSTVILAGSCLPLTTMTVPFLAIRSATRDAHREGISLPSVMWSEDSPANVPIMFDAWLEDLCSDRLVILAIDDLHWADQSTLDVLMYVLAGSSDRRLAVIATIRSSEVGEGHPLQRWLADIRRLPRVEQMTLDPLDRLATAAQIAGLLGAPPHQLLVEDVLSHTQGNPYLNRLVVNGLPPDARLLPPDLPADLKSAVLQSWRRLSAPTRELARILAVGGAPLHAEGLNDVVGNAPDSADILSLLHEAVDAGTLDVARDGTYCFHHPLSAEVLEQTLSDDERRRWHAAFADHDDKEMADDPAPAIETMIAVAGHHDRAGHLTEAYRWALRASDAAGAAGGASEMLRLLRRAAELRTHLAYADEDERDLLRRLMAAAAAAGAHEEELRAVDLLLDDVDPGTDPLLVAALLVRRTHLRFSTGRAFFTLDDMQEAVRLSATDPASWQHALALAELAHAETWHGDPGAAAHADRALTVARVAGDPRALSHALTAKAMVAIFGQRGEDGHLFAIEAADYAVQALDFWALCHATMWEANALETWSSRLYANHLRRARERLAELGAPHAYVALLSAHEASSWLAIGAWRECLDRLRVALGSDSGPFADVSARLTAARLAAWQGRADEATAHLARADELFAESSAFLNYNFDAVRAEACLANGCPQAAFDAAMAGATSPGVPPTMCEWLIPLASRALADQIQTDRDAGQDPSVLLARLDNLTARFPAVIRDFGASSPRWELQISALGELYAAEVGRARQVPDNGTQWVRTADSCHTAMLAWEEAYACWRAAEAMFVRGSHHRVRAAAVLRRGLALADELGARPLRIDLEALAKSARISVARVTVSPSPSEQRTALPGLTAREREILDHVVAGHTYGEIARDLIISEKTVSSHIIQPVAEDRHLEPGGSIPSGRTRRAAQLRPVKPRRLVKGSQTAARASEGGGARALLTG